MSKAGTITMDDCWFYHSIDIPGWGPVTGQWDMRGRVADYTGNVDLSGRTFLDVGAASGFLTFETEKRGALVTSFDAESEKQYQFIPGRNIPDPETFRRMRNGYWLSHAAFKSKAKTIYGDGYRLSEIAPMHDVTMVGQILVHLRDPLEALRQASLVAKTHLVITEGSFASERPVAVFYGDDESPYAWWNLSDALYKKWLAQLGFDLISVIRNKYRCNYPADNGMEELWTYVAKRR